jgi:hypothetical protein
MFKIMVDDVKYGEATTKEEAEILVGKMEAEEGIDPDCIKIEKKLPEWMLEDGENESDDGDDGEWPKDCYESEVDLKTEEAVMDYLLDCAYNEHDGNPPFDHRTFGEAGLMTNDKGVVLDFGNGRKFMLTIKKM